MKGKVLSILILLGALGFPAEAADQVTGQRETGLEAKLFTCLREAKDHLADLKRERDVLVGDFFGINITAYRYENIFYRRGYIRHRIEIIDKDILRTQNAIRKLRKDRR